MLKTTILVLVMLTALGGCTGPGPETDAPAPAQECDTRARPIAVELTPTSGSASLDTPAMAGGEYRYHDVEWADAARVEAIEIEASWNATVGASRLWFQLEDLGSGAVLGTTEAAPPLTWRVDGIPDRTEGLLRIKAGPAPEHGVPGASAGVIVQDTPVLVRIDQVLGCA